YRKRSKDQNRFYWGSLVTPLAAHFQCDKQRMHELLKHLFLTGHKRLSTANGALQLPYVRSTKSLDSDEFEAYCTRIRAWALDQL
ncbi:MAG: hypothetical protein AAGB22_07840, partial [Bacteroidota bacterium]